MYNSNPRATHVARRFHRVIPARRFWIPTHAPRTWRDQGRPLLRTGLQIPTHAPRTWRDVMVAGYVPRDAIPTHAPRTWRDNGYVARRLREKQFQPTRHARGATIGSYHYPGEDTSFQPTRHARGATRHSHCQPVHRQNSNPRATHVARPPPRADASRPSIFQPTRHARGATE